MRSKYSKLRTKREVRAVYTALNRLLVISKSYDSIDELRFAIMLMKAELRDTEQLIEINELKEQQKTFNSWVEHYMSCQWGPCHKCHHLNNGCYEPTQEMVDEIKHRWEQNNGRD